MAGNYAQLLDIINNPTNHSLPAWNNNNKLIEGLTVKQYLLTIINSLTVGYQFMGVATPSTSPGTPDQNVFYIGGAGTYANFGTSITVKQGQICVFKWNGSWTNTPIEIANSGFVNVNDVNGRATAYGSASAARSAVPTAYRKAGLNITYLLNTGWVTEHFIGDDVSDWGVNTNWESSNAIVEQGLPKGSPLPFNSIIYNKYPKSDGTLATLSGQQAKIYDVSNVDYLLIRWGASSTNTNYGVLFSNSASFDTIASYITPYTQTAGQTIVKVPDGVSYVVGLNGTLSAVDGKAITDITNDLYAEFKRIESDFNSYTPLTFSGRIQGYLNTGGTQSGGASFATNLYAVTRGQHIYFKQNVASPYAYFGLCDDLSASHVLYVSSSNYGEFVEIVVPDGANYLMVNAATEKTADYPSTLQCLGFPKLDLTNFAEKTQKVYNYFPAYSLNKQNISYNGITRSAVDSIIIDDTFISLGANRCISFDLSSQKRLWGMSPSMMRDIFKSTGKLRVCFDVICSTSWKSISVKLYTWGGTTQHYDKDFLCGTTIKHFDYTFEVNTSEISSITSLDLYIYAASSGSYSVKIANVIITDDIFDKTPIPQYSQDWNALQRPTNPYLYKTCIYFGDSISTADQYKWKGLMWDIYRIGYVADGGGINPAQGGITVRPDANGLTPGTDKYSIWYRCANARFANKTFDFINLFGGQNDKGIDASLLGAITDKPYVDDASTFDTPSNYTDVWTDSLTFAQCYMGCIEMLQRDYPTKEIMLMTVYPTRGDTAVSESMAILQIQIAKKYGLKITPLWWNIFDSNAVEAFTLDGVHPSDVLARQMCIRFSQTLGI